MARALAWACALALAGCVSTVDGGMPPADETPDLAGAPADADGGVSRPRIGPDAGNGSGNGNGNAVGPAGGAVDLLHFALTGDTRPPSCGDTAGYPTAIFDGIVARIAARAPDFVLDLGDHMYVCNDDLPTAQTQMGLYLKSAKAFPGTWFMTMGNHECSSSPCLAGSTNANYVAFMQAMAPIAPKPYYTFDVQTSKGLATFVVIADNAWDNAQQTWLEQTLAKADQAATYTIVARHHPSDDTSVYTNPTSMGIVRQHKFALFLTGHSHLYKHSTSDGGRDLVLGTGGAPLIAGGAFYGYAMVDQSPDGRLTVTAYESMGDKALDTWSVGPN